MVYIDVIFVLSVCIYGGVSSQSTGCQWPKHKGNNPAMDRLKPLEGKVFSVEDNEEDGYKYTIGICKSAITDGSGATESAGVLQYRKDGQGSPKTVGLFTQASIMAGTDWLLVEYKGGDTYGSHCNNEPRKASIMIVCDPKETEGFARVIEENTNKTDECYYLFEIEHQAACADGKSQEYGLSVGSILLVIFGSVTALYLIGGFIYQRFIVGAKGMEQIPNYAFWQDLGNLEADGCNFVCRSGSRRSESRQYRGIGDDQLQADEEDDRDDNLLPM